MAMQTRSGRPREFDTDDALDTALDVFWRHGYSNTSTRQLEASLGIAQSSLYNAFGSKRELFDAALDQYEQQVTNELLGPLETNRGIDGVVGFLDDLLRWITAEGRRGCMIINLMAGESDDEVFAARTAAFRNRLRVALAASMCAEPDIDQPTAAGHAEVVLAAALGLNIAARGGASTIELGRMIDAAKAHVAAWRS